MLAYEDGKTSPHRPYTRTADANLREPAIGTVNGEENGTHPIVHKMNEN